MNAMQTGSIKWFNATKGFGFVTPDAGGKDVFLHQSALDRAGITAAPADGQKVSFITEQKAKGPSVSTIKLL